MTLRSKTGITLLAVLVLIGATRAQAGVIETADRDEWFALVGAVTTLTFTEFPEGTWLTDQYEDLLIRE